MYHEPHRLSPIDKIQILRNFITENYSDLFDRIFLPYHTNTCGVFFIFILSGSINLSSLLSIIFVPLITP